MPPVMVAGLDPADLAWALHATTCDCPGDDSPGCHLRRYARGAKAKRILDALPRDNDNLPDLGDAVLLGRDRFRIREIDQDGTCRLRVDWGEERAAANVNRLHWDRFARAWREEVTA